MIQELFGVAGLIAGENKISINGGILESTTPSTSLISPSSLSSASSTVRATTATAISTTATTTATTTSTSSEGQNLRCPRCDSSNTKFCYYNNYNLTQPRHFCKTCRRYWTKGGALRNVPIGGGCRKNKSAATVAASVGKSGVGKLKTLSSEFGRAGFGAGFDQDVSPSQILWGSPQNSHLLAVLRSATQNPNPNLNQTTLHNVASLKAELATMVGSHMVNEPASVATSTSEFHGRTMSFDPMSHLPSLGLCSSYWRNNQNQVQQQNGFAVNDQIHNNGIQELYQKLRSSSTNYFTDQPAVSLTNVTSTSAILESAPVAGGETGYWNPSFSWSDLHTSTNGSYP